MDSEIEALIQSFSEDLPKRAGEVQEAVDAVLESLTNGGAARWDELVRRTHKLAGSSGTYGFLQLSTVCAYLEELVETTALRKLERPVAAEHLRRWTEIFAEQWRLAAARKTAYETPEQLLTILRRHWTTVTGGKAA